MIVDLVLAGDLMYRIVASLVAALMIALATPAFAQQDPGYMGVQVRSLTKQEADKLGWEAPRGAWVTQLLEDGPALAAGIAPGDIIASIDGLEIADQATFVKTVREKQPGTQLR